MTIVPLMQTIKPSQRGDPWFDDGNIVLVSEDSSVAFRVHRDFLSRHSEIFRSMFDVAQSTDVELLDNCPVVRMFDLPNELRHLLKALYDSTKLEVFP